MAPARSSSSDRFAALSILLAWRSDASQGGQDLLPGSGTRREEPAERAQDHGKRYAQNHDLGGHTEIKIDFTKRNKTPDASSDPVERQHQQAAYDTTKRGQQNGLDEETEQNTATGKAKHAESADFLGAPRDRGIHGVHGGETGAHAHDDGYEDSQVLDHHARIRLRLIVIHFRNSVEVQALVVGDVIDQGLGGDGISGAEQHGTQRVGPLEVRAHLVEVAENLAIGRAGPGGHDADDVPVAAPEMQALADTGGGKALLNGLSHDHFPTSGLKPAAGNELQVIAHFETCLRDAAQGHVDALWCIAAGVINDRNHLERRQVLPGI